MTHLKTLLVPVDFSAHSDHAFEVAGSLARDYAGKLILVYVIPPPVVGGPGIGMITYPPVEDDENEILDKLLKMKSAGPAVRVECFVRRGNPATVILEMARESMCDLIVIGTHGRTGISRLLMGSVAEQVLRRAACPVLTVKGASEPAVAASKTKTAASASS
jgi:nucleotide-binding universal stress UspA family protein